MLRHDEAAVDHLAVSPVDPGLPPAAVNQPEAEASGLRRGYKLAISGNTQGLRYWGRLRYRLASSSPISVYVFGSRRRLRPARQAALPRWHNRLEGWPTVSRSADRLGG